MISWMCDRCETGYLNVRPVIWNGEKKLLRERDSLTWNNWFHISNNRCHNSKWPAIAHFPHFVSEKRRNHYSYHSTLQTLKKMHQNFSWVTGIWKPSANPRTWRSWIYIRSKWARHPKYVCQFSLFVIYLSIFIFF